MLRRGVAPLFLAVLLLAGCAQQPLSPVDNFERYQSRLAAIDHWKLSGKMNMRVPGESDTVRVLWNNRARQYDIRLSGSLGMGATWIRGDRNGVRLEQAGEDPVFAASPEDLVYTQLGRQIPISELRYWVRGLPAPGPRPERSDFTAEGMLSILEQSGWTLRYSNYQAVGPWNLPGKILAERDDLRLTLLISGWELP
ncbi:lipoprotein insertase outer membrane protein LolB [Gilvimarinus sp. F26214L]|uniref:lipoprotein insertase outer membrane protein LolB n=1 Tax=Gilvimarinus sp. DZF01 TaxID=3461371 RepID=UPI0040464F8F